MLSFLGIGAQKAGTSWLHAALARHPSIGFPCGKEVHLWDRPHTPADIDSYLSRFLDPSLAEGEITPAYALNGLDVIREIQVRLPKLRLIYLIRNPVERAWSSALMALGRAEMEIAEASDQWFIDHFRSAGSRGRGDYERCIRRWRSVFGSDALLVLRFDDILLRPQQLVFQCFDHVGVSAISVETLRGWDLEQRVFAGPQTPIRPSLRPLLSALYAEPIDSLAAYLSWDLSDWHDENAPQQ